MFNLLCYVHDEDDNNAFEVTIGKEEKVYGLKKAIKKETGQTFRHVDASSLMLWKVSVPCDQNLKKNVDDLHLTYDELPQSSLQSLWPLDELSEVFSEPPIEKHVHIIVMAPPSKADLVEQGDLIMALVRASKFLPLVLCSLLTLCRVQGSRQEGSEFKASVRTRGIQRL
jgi:hypothetical protein